MQRQNVTKINKSNKKDELFTTILFLLPSFIMLTLFAVIPLIILIFKSFFESSPYIDSIFIGLANYKKILIDDVFWTSVINGFKYVLAVVPIQIVLAFFLSLLIINLPKKLGSILKVVIYIPCVFSGIVTGVIFMYLYEYDSGILNNFFQIFNIDKINYLGDPKIALFAVALASIWGGTGYVTLIMLGGILDIPKDYYDAATIDGANSFKQTIYITIPLLKNIGLYLLVTCFVSTFQLFELPFIMTGGGPMNSTMGPVGYLYQRFSYDDTLGMTYAGGVLIAIFISLVSMILFSVFKSQKNLED